MQVKEFQDENDFYGLKPETLDSLILELLPPLGHTYKDLERDNLVDKSQEVPVYLLRKTLNALRNSAGFHIPKVRHTCKHAHVSSELLYFSLLYPSLVPH